MTESGRAPQVTKVKPLEGVEWLPSARHDPEEDRKSIRTHAAIGPFVAALTLYGSAVFGDGDWGLVGTGATLGLFGAVWPLAFLAGWSLRMRTLGVARFRLSPHLAGLVLSVACIVILIRMDVDSELEFYGRIFATMAGSSLLIVPVIHLALPRGELRVGPRSGLALTVALALAPLALTGFGLGLFWIGMLLTPVGIVLLFFGPLLMAWLQAHLATRVIMRAFVSPRHRSLDAVPEAFE